MSPYKTERSDNTGSKFDLVITISCQIDDERFATEQLHSYPPFPTKFTSLKCYLRMGLQALSLPVSKRPQDSDR